MTTTETGDKRRPFLVEAAGPCMDCSARPARVAVPGPAGSTWLLCVGCSQDRLTEEMSGLVVALTASVDDGPLGAARDHLAARREKADGAADWKERELLVQLADVADMTCRIGSVTSAHYRAERSGDLVAAALRLHHVALVQYAAGACDDDTFDTIEAQFQELLDMEAAVVGQITLGQWILARHGAELYRSDVARLRAAVGDLSAWAEKLAATAVPDPVECG